MEAIETDGRELERLGSGRGDLSGGAEVRRGAGQAKDAAKAGPEAGGKAL